MLVLQGYGEALVKQGSKNQDVSALQAMLKDKGFYFGQITGIFDTFTRNAVISFQKSNSLVQDGIVGPNTWNALKGIETVAVKEERKTEGEKILNRVENIISRKSEGLFPKYIPIFGYEIPTLYFGFGIIAIIGIVTYMNINKPKDFTRII